MPLKLSVGLTKKIGQPDFGSLAASCSVELELPASMMAEDLEGFHRQARNAYTACRQAVQEELARQQGQPVATSNGRAGPAEPSSPAATDGNASGSRGNGQGGGHAATEKQLTYARQLSGQVKGLGVRKLETLSQKLHGKPLAGLSTLEASGLIDTLKAIKAGEIDLDAALDGAAR